jgi:hypothetical protein
VDGDDFVAEGLVDETVGAGVGAPAAAFDDRAGARGQSVALAAEQVRTGGDGVAVPLEPAAGVRELAGAFGREVGEDGASSRPAARCAAMRAPYSCNNRSGSGWAAVLMYGLIW